MKNGLNILLLFAVIIMLLISVPLTGCDYIKTASEVNVHEDLDFDDIELEEIKDEEPITLSTYFWPWIHHGTIVLSSGEIILGPDILESDQGFIGEYPFGKSYRGQLIWVVQETDIRSIEWIELNFDVDFYESNEWSYTTNYSFRVEVPILDDDEADNFSFNLNLDEEKNSFRVSLYELIMAEGQEGSFINKPIDYVGFVMEINILEEQ